MVLLGFLFVPAVRCFLLFVFFFFLGSWQLFVVGGDQGCGVVSFFFYRGKKKGEEGRLLHVIKKKKGNTGAPPQQT
ncbi:hypothetical protein DV030_16390 [Lacticaseibacillus paracasei]|nr:hypothetical protein [Lacticaseibacillus paracasei]